MRRIACNGGSLKNGGSPSTISMIMMPNDQMSTSGPYGNLEKNIYIYKFANQSITSLFYVRSCPFIPNKLRIINAKASPRLDTRNRIITTEIKQTINTCRVLVVVY